MIKYEHIEYLYLLFGIPFLIIAILLYNKWKKKALSLFGSTNFVIELLSSFSKKRMRIKNILTVLIFILLIIGLANPKVGAKMEEVKREGVDLMIAIDLYNSMMAEDIKPNRLGRAKQAISKLIDKLEGDRIGLIVFAGEAYVQLPVTTDYSAAKLFLSTVSTNIIPTQGTEIAKAIDLSVQSFDMKNAQNKAVIIITDGENHDENAIESAKQANKLGVFVHTLGMGLSKGVPIPVYNDDGKRTKAHRKYEGEYISTKINENLLMQIANAGKGTYVRANNSKAGLSALFDKINEMEKKEIGTMVITEYKDRFQLFIGLTLILLILDLILLSKKNTWINLINFYKK